MAQKTQKVAEQKHPKKCALAKLRLSNRLGWVGRGAWVRDRPCIHVMYTYFYAVSIALSQQRFFLRSLSSIYTEWLLRDCAEDVPLTGFPCTLTFNNNSDLRMSNSRVYPPWARLLANTCISAIFNQSYWSIPTLPNKQLNGRYKADVWRLILSFHEINKSWPNVETKIPWDVC